MDFNATFIVEAIDFNVTNDFNLVDRFDAGKIDWNNTTDLLWAHPVMMTFSALRIIGNTACASICARSNNDYKWFTPLFTAEVVAHSLLFIYEFFLNYYNPFLHENIWFCDFLVNEMHFVNNTMIYIYAWSIFFFLFQDKKPRTEAQIPGPGQGSPTHCVTCTVKQDKKRNEHPFSFLFFSIIFVFGFVAAVVEARMKEESTCFGRQFTYISFYYMFANQVTMCLTLLVLVGWFVFHRISESRPTDNNSRQQQQQQQADNKTDNERTWFKILFTGVAVRMLALNALMPFIVSHQYSYVLIPIRATPLLFPIVFIYVTGNKYITRPSIETDVESSVPPRSASNGESAARLLSYSDAGSSGEHSSSSGAVPSAPYADLDPRNLNSASTSGSQSAYLTASERSAETRSLLNPSSDFGYANDAEYDD